MTLSEKSAYLKGLMEGMKLDTEANEGKLLAAIVDLLGDMAKTVSDVEETTLAISDELDEIEEDLDEVYDYLSEEEDDFDDEDDLDDELRQNSIGWDISRISKLARCILRLAIYEILYVDDVPTGVAVAEAVRIAKKYDGDDTGAFINGILGSFVRSRNTEAAAPQEEVQ